MGKLINEDLTRSVIGAFFEVYNVLGFGFSESIYAAALTVSSGTADTLFSARSKCPSCTRAL